MSRIPRKDVWRRAHGMSHEAPCACCGVIIKRDSATWERGHIIPARLLGPDIHENIQPICLRCNIEDKQYPSTWHYAAHIGKITTAEADSRVAAIWKTFDRQREDPSLRRCLTVHCKHASKPPDMFCAKHSPQAPAQLAKYCSIMRKRGCLRLELQMREAEACGDIEYAEACLRMLLDYDGM